MEDSAFKGCVDFNLTNVKLEEAGKKGQTLVMNIQGVNRKFRFRGIETEQYKIEHWRHALRSQL
jgi:hypothetical protein